MLDIADDGDCQSFELALVLADGQQVEQTIAGIR